MRFLDLLLLLYILCVPEKATLEAGEKTKHVNTIVGEALLLPARENEKCQSEASEKQAV